MNATSPRDPQMFIWALMLFGLLVLGISLAVRKLRTQQHAKGFV